MKKIININTPAKKVTARTNHDKMVELRKFKKLVESLDWENVSYSMAKNLMHIHYLGTGCQSAKLLRSFRAGTYTYGIYLAPWNLASQLSGVAGMNVCPGGTNCHEHCLNGSGQNKMDEMARGQYSNINMARAKRTILYYHNRKLFNKLLIHEIHKAKDYAERHNYDFSVRLNCTSDIDLRMFVNPKNGKNVLNIYPEVQFYDYTKIISHYKLVEDYDNYHLTFSYDGKNWDKCEKVLNNFGQVAVVFDGPMPETFRGFKVVSGDNYDMRYIDPHGVVIGLTYHKTAQDYVNGKYVHPNSSFVVRTDAEVEQTAAI